MLRRQNYLPSRKMEPSSQLAAGLLRILRQAAWLRGGLVALAILLYLALYPGKGALALLIVFAVERALFIALVSWDTLRKIMGAAFLPVALAWLLVMPMVEIVISILLRDETLLVLGLQADALGVSSPLIWLVVPVILAAWQYGQTGLRIAIGALVVEHLALGAILWSDVKLDASFILNAGGRIVMLTILGYVVMLLVQAQKKDHAALEQANRQLAQRAATVEQLAESHERNRMARELHDILAHSLTGLNIQLQAIGKLLDTDPAEAKVELHEAQTTTRASANEVRRAIQALRATPLQDLGLAQALRELCRAQAERTGAKFDCAITDIPALDPLTEQAVYRIAHETLANVERHAAATQVTVRLQAHDHKLHLAIHDNGLGFELRAVPKGRFGLIGMTERARDVGGELSVQSELDHGTKVELEIPI